MRNFNFCKICASNSSTNDLLYGTNTIAKLLRLEAVQKRKRAGGLQEQTNSCRIMISNNAKKEHVLAKIGVDPAENGPKVKV